MLFVSARSALLLVVTVDIACFATTSDAAVVANLVLEIDVVFVTGVDVFFELLLEGIIFDRMPDHWAVSQPLSHSDSFPPKRLDRAPKL